MLLVSASRAISVSENHHKGRMIESAIGAHLINDPKCEVFYWREGNKEVDFVIKIKGKLIAIEVKIGGRFYLNFIEQNEDF